MSQTPDCPVRLLPVKAHQRPTLESLMQTYLHELSAFAEIPTNADGLYEVPYLKRYFTAPDRWPLLIDVGAGEGEQTKGEQTKCGHVGGFVLVRQEHDPGTGHAAMEVAEFFVLNQWRRQGVGTRSAAAVWHKFPGHWHLQVLQDNTSALKFWRRTIADVDQQFTETAPSRKTKFQIRFEFQVG